MKQAGLALPDPMLTAPENWTESYVITGRLIAAIRGQEELQTADHSACILEVRTLVRKRSVLLADESLAENLAGYPFQGARQLWRAKKTGTWLTVQPSTVKGTKLVAQEW